MSLGRGLLFPQQEMTKLSLDTLWHGARVTLNDKLTNCSRHLDP